MFRKRRQPAPFFRLPGAPFNPATGENALLGQFPSKGTTLALFQVIGDDPNDPNTQDTHDNYVVCRGYEADNDPEFRFLHDPYTAPTTTPINVAKPYSVRGTFPYELGQVIVAARIKGKLGFNPGAGASIGQPANLDEEIGLLKDDADVVIAWMDLGTSTAPPNGRYFETATQAGGIPVLNWSTTTVQVGDFASVPGTFDRINITAGTAQPYLVTVTIRTRAIRAGINLTLLSATLLVDGVSLVDQDVYSYSDGIADVVHVLSRILTLTAGSHIQVTLSAPSSTGLSGSGRIQILPFNP